MEFDDDIEPKTIRMLGLRVIEQAVWDVYGPCEGNSNVSADRRAERDRTHRWFNDAGKGFADICAMAGVDPEHVQEQYKSGALKRAYDADKERKRRDRAREKANRG